MRDKTFDALAITVGLAMGISILFASAHGRDKAYHQGQDEVRRTNFVVPPTTIDGIPLVLDTEGRVGTCSISVTVDRVEELRCKDER